MGTARRWRVDEPRHAVRVVGTPMPAGAIIAVVVTAAAGVTAAVVLSAATLAPKPSQPAGSLPTTHAAASLRPAVGPGMLRGNGTPPVVLASTVTLLADGDAPTVELADGVTVTVAAGWTVDSLDEFSARLYNSDHSAAIIAGAGHAVTSEIGQETLRHMRYRVIQDSGLTNVQEDWQLVQPVQGKNFTQKLQVKFTADQQTDRGTVQLYGKSVTLFNPSTQEAGSFTFYAAGTDALNAVEPDATSMLASML
jgi:hypothetical protein